MEKPMRVLVVEDHAELAETVATGLRREGMAVDIALDGVEALERASVTEYDVVVLDRDLPRLGGDEVCRSLAAGGPGPCVLMLTAAGSVEDRVDGLGLGADDYLSKPFAFAAPVLPRGEVRLEPALRVAARAGRRLWLTPKEFAVLELLMAADGRPIPAEELLERAWDEMTDPFTATVKVTISRLRQKLGEPELIKTLPQAGYRMLP